MKLTRFAPIRDVVNAARLAVGYLSPARREAHRLIQEKRQATDRLFADLCGKPATPFVGEVLVDAQWDNPNYWLRISLLRAALGLPNGSEVGVLGTYNRRECARTMATLGIESHTPFPHIAVDSAAIRREAERLVAETRCAGDILDWDLPGGVPGHLIYDGILKRQRLASVDVSRRDFLPLTIEGLTGIRRAQQLLDDHDFKLAIISHPINFTCGAIAHQALLRGIPVVLPFGLFGVVRMTRFHRPEELTEFYDRPTRTEIDNLVPDRANAMAEIGRQYFRARFDGKADDLASVYAYRRSAGGITRDEMCERFSWDPVKPIVGFYASNWFDWPHQLGMTQFRDFLDWTEATFAAATNNKSVNWLFKPHPCEQWFGGISLQGMLHEIGAAANVAIADAGWNNTAVMNCLDALVTYHGTAGIEFASLAKPVLVPDKGKYDDAGFVKVATDRADYLKLLGGQWWSDMDLEDCRRRAEIFAGCWFCAPEWQGGFILADDSRQNDLYESLPELLTRNTTIVEREIRQLREWYASGHRYSHTYKMMHAEAFRLTNVG